jgi:predicted RNA-binding protein with TRAM domain
MRLFAWACLSLLWVSNASARDMQTGNYVLGGGIGGVKCAQFLNSMAGIREINGFVQFVSGAQTGFNYEHDGYVNILEPLKPDELYNALYAIEPWCAANPERDFGVGVLTLMERLRKK